MALETERNHRLDFYKGLLIWGVIWGHSITAMLNGDVNDIGIHRIFRTYDMPFFMMISGFLFSFSTKKYGFGKLLLNKMTTLAFPTVLWSLLFFHRQSPIGSYYFVWAVFWSSCVVGAINSLTNNRILQVTSFVLLTIGLHFLPFSPISLYNLAYLFPYFIIGFYAWPLLEKARKYALFIVPIYAIAFCFWKTHYSIWYIGANVLYGGDIFMALFLRSVIALSGIATASIGFDMLYGFLLENRPKVAKWIEAFGQETLGIYILQAFVVFRILAYTVQIAERHLGFNYLAYNHRLLGYVIAPLVSFAVMAVCFLFVRFCKSKKYLKFLFGFKNETLFINTTSPSR